VQTVDFFTPIVDDPYDYGQIAAANSLSDVYAMGGRPITAMNIVGVPDKVPHAVVNRILRGGAAKVKQAGCALLGGHSIRNPEPIYGLSVTGLVHPKRMITNAAARPGDLLVLTKPIGTGIASTAVKRGIAPAGLEALAVRIMSQLNAAGADLAEAGLVKAGTDVTGFGLLGHLAGLCRASGVTAEIVAADVPLLSTRVLELIDQGCVPGGTMSNLEAVEGFVRWGDAVPPPLRTALADAQTSGGLLLCVAPGKLADVTAILKRHRAPVQAVIGRIVKGTPGIAVS
jgi:selenide,water dikinase